MRNCVISRLHAVKNNIHAIYGELSMSAKYGKKNTPRFQVRQFLLRELEFKDELARQDSESTEKKVAAYESLLLDCKDAIQVLLQF